MKQINDTQLQLSATIGTQNSSPHLTDKEKLLFSAAQTLRYEFGGVEEIKNWKRTLERFHLDELQQAFNRWIDNETWFPKPAEIVEVIETKHRLDSEQIYRRGTYGGGNYGGQPQIIMLWNMFHQKYPKPIGRPLTAEERSELLDEFDKRIHV